MLTLALFSFILNNIINVYRSIVMTVSEQVKIACVKAHVSQAELARRLGQSPQSLSAKIRRATITVEDLERIAEVLGFEFCHEFVCPDGTKF